MRLKIENLKTKQGFGYREIARGTILQSCKSGYIYMFLKYKYNGRVAKNDVNVLRIKGETKKFKTGSVHQISHAIMFRILEP